MSQQAIRAAQLADGIRDFLAKEIARDFTGYLITVSQVTLSPDLLDATVWVTTFRAEDKRKVLQKLRTASRGYQRNLHKQLRRHTSPRLRFEADYNVEEGERLDELLK
jgi:ribosome-binding factor A